MTNNCSPPTEPAQHRTTNCRTPSAPRSYAATETEVQSSGGGTLVSSLTSSFQANTQQDQAEKRPCEEGDDDVTVELEKMLMDSRREVAMLTAKLHKQEKADKDLTDQVADLKSLKEECSRLAVQLKDAKLKESAAQEDRKEWERKVDELEKLHKEALGRLKTTGMKNSIKWANIPLIA